MKVCVNPAGRRSTSVGVDDQSGQRAFRTTWTSAEDPSSWTGRSLTEAHKEQQQGNEDGIRGRDPPLEGEAVAPQ